MANEESWNGPMLTLRDYFAGQALIGWLAMHSDSDCNAPKAETSAEYCYQIADAMLVHRAKAGK